MFAGIGGFRAGLTLADDFECVGHCEIDPHADKSYRTIHNIKESEVFYPDAREIQPRDMPEFDLLCGGFPCQSFSNAGKRKGFEDARGTLFFEIARVVKERRPKYLLLENVPGLLSHDGGRTYSTILATLNDLGYSVEWSVLNSKHFGVPQARRRVFIVGYLDRRCAGKILPVFGANGKTLVRLAGGKQGYTVYDSDGLACTQTAGTGGLGGKTGLYFVGFNRKDGITGLLDTAKTLNASDFRGINRNQTQNAVFEGEACAVINPTKEKVWQNGSRIKKPGAPMFCLTTADRHGVLLIKEATKRGYKEAHEGDSVDLGYAGSNTRRGRIGKDIAHTLDTGSTQGVVRQGRIRRLMPRECLRLQGFTDEQIDKILSITSDAQAYKQAGNCVTVNVIYAIALCIKAVDEALKRGGLS